MGRLRNARVLQHDATAREDLRQRRRRTSCLLRIRRGLRNLLQRPRRQVPGPTRRDAAEDVTSHNMEAKLFFTSLTASDLSSDGSWWEIYNEAFPLTDREAPL